MKIQIIKRLLMLLVLFSGVFHFQDLSNKRLEFSLTGGSLLPGNVEASHHSDFHADSTVTIKNKLSSFIKVTADLNVGMYISQGLNLYYAKFNIKDLLFKRG